MRTVSFVDCFELEFEGSVFSKAMIAADVDNDNHNELAIGNVHGDLLIFKGYNADGKPWAKATELGMISCVEVGDVCNRGLNYLVSLSSEGWCHIFSVRPDTPVPSQESDVIDDVRLLRPIFRQRLAANSKAVVITDIDGDGLNELVVAHTDRVVRAYRWWSADDSSGAGKTQTTATLVAVDKWLLTGQVGSMSVNQSVSGQASVLVSQPGGSFVTLIPNTSQTAASASSAQSSDCVCFHAVGSVRARNPIVSTEVVGSISRVKKHERDVKESSSSSSSSSVPCNYYSAICTLDGTITLLDEDKILWSLFVDHQLFALTKFDVTGDGTEEVVACSWDGQTYFVNLSKEVVRFHFRENVAAFCAGSFTMDRDRCHVPCLFYATFNNKICVHYNVRLKEIGTSNLFDAMQQLCSATGVECPGKGMEPGELRKLYHQCLYYPHTLPSRSQRQTRDEHE